MVSFKTALVAALQIVAVTAVDITVESSGGNYTGGYHYGFLHEVPNLLACHPYGKHH